MHVTLLFYLQISFGGCDFPADMKATRQMILIQPSQTHKILTGFCNMLDP